MIVFTICARNFLAQALVLHESLLRHHPETEFRLALCDAADGMDTLAFPFRVMPLDELGIPRLDQMIGRYNITELNTAIKPYVFATLFEAFPGRAIVYLDPDILVTGRLAELEQELTAGADCVLTPHLCEPAEFAEMHDGRILQYGSYNLGFLALRATPDVRRVVTWWARRLEHYCVIDLAAGLFVDQRWAELLPSFIERTRILRHPGYNVAYWNLSQRTVRYDGVRWQVNGEPLRFVHFSGSQLGNPPVFSRHSEQFTRGRLGDLDALFEDYVDAAHRHGMAYYRSIPYAFRWNSGSGENPHAPSTLAHGGAVAGAGPRPLAAEMLPHLPILRAASLAEYSALQLSLADIERDRRALEDELASTGGDPFHLDGHCVVCGGRTRFCVGSMYAVGTTRNGRPLPNWREHMDCMHCGLVNRLRAVLHVLAQEVRPPADASIYLTEQVTPLFRWFADRFDNVTGSEFLGAECEPGTLIEGVRHEDIERLSFADARFDLAISLEVLEHVPHPGRALAELRRCLRPGGTLVLTAPFHVHRQEHEIRARLRCDGTIEHLMPPEYHGNPVDPGAGALCYRYYGWQLMDDLRSAGFSSAKCLFFWSREYGYLGPTSTIVLARA